MALELVFFVQNFIDIDPISPVSGVNHISGLTLITCYVYNVSGYFGIIIYSRETFIRGSPFISF
jgi:hypothetical protein